MPRDPIALATLAAAVSGQVVGDGAAPVSDVRHDSRAAGPGDLFVAVRGLRTDGHRFLTAAVAAGAVAVCVERAVPGAGAPQLVVADTRAALGPLAALVHGDPSHRLPVVGVTGTNGKTTVTHLLEAIAAAAGLRPGVIGTLGARLDGRPVPLARTTPEASDLQRMLARMADEGVALVAMEVSSHALALRRVDATRFRVAAFTNLTQDHLDFHGDMDAYFAAKAGLFDPGRAADAVVWVDDPWGRRLLNHELGGAATTAGWDDADVTARDVVLGPGGARFRLVTPAGGVPVTLALAGRFNVANAVVAAACAHVLGVPLQAIAAGLAAVERIPGRFERISPAGGGPVVVVDYAHTPAGIAAAVAAGRELAAGRVIVVAGAGGDRDRDKRAAMGAAAAAADVAVITSDNPRTEPPAAIVAAVAAGARAAGGGEVVEIVDRRAAIAAAVAGAGDEDLVLILGKGHETGQDLGDRVIPFDDRDEAREALQAR